MLIIGANLDADEGWELQTSKNDAVRSLGPPASDHSTLMDIRQLRIQPQELIHAFVDYSQNTKLPSKKVAILFGEGTSRMQFRRIIQSENVIAKMELFTDRDEALAWLKA
ncbi:hypothetical protein [Novosphingopyxis iocasae]|uniref:hypothetical protein n=1 Tax=Novosphingopyxis iocasae TaxID=2762729 RepID=UPI0016511D2F|nr:hypothetical protein [Novosphingopyxis iocasae]